MYDYYSGIVTTYKKSTILQYPCISVVDNLSNILHFAPCTMHWHCIFLKWTDMGVYKLWLQPHLSWWNDIMLMFLLYCIFHHGNKVLFYSILFYSILFYSILFCPHDTASCHILTIGYPRYMPKISSRTDVLTHRGLVTPCVTQIWVNIGSCNGLLPDGSKPLPKPMLTYHQ